MNTSSLWIIVAANQYTSYLREELAIKVKIYICVETQCIQLMSEQTGPQWDLLFACVFLMQGQKCYRFAVPVQLVFLCASS